MTGRHRSRGRGPAARRVAICTALALLAATTLAAPAAQAAKPKAQRAGWACALKRNGQLRGVSGPSSCRGNESAVHLHPGPVFVCVQQDRTVRKVAELARCAASHPKRKGLTLPPSTGAVYFCRRTGHGRGLLRYVPRPRRCPRGSRLVYVPHRPLAVNDAYATTEDTALNVTAPGVLANDDSPTGRPLTAALMSGPAHAASFALHADGSFSYRPAANFNGGDAFTYTIGDRHAGSDAATVTIAVAAVNDAPVNIVPAAQSTNEDTALALSHAAGNRVSTSDVDAGGADVLSSLTATHGTLTLSGTAGLTLINGDGTDDATITVRGSVGAIDTALNGLRYEPAADYNGPAAITLTTNDLGHTGAGGARSDSDVLAVTVNAVDDAPVNSLPGAQIADDALGLVLSSAHGNAISTSDVDAGSSPVQVTLGVGHGTLTLPGTAGLSFSTGDGTADATMTFTGTLSDVNAALDGLSYTPTSSSYMGADSLTVTTDDQGATGAGGPLSDTDVLALTVQQVNRAPVNAVPIGQLTPAGTPIVVFSSAGGNPISTSDADAGTNPVKITLSVDHGTLTLSSTSGLSFTTGSGSGNTTMTFTGSLVDVNSALDGLVYVATAGYDGADSLTLSTDDQGNTGAGGAKTDTDTVAITVQHGAPPSAAS